MNNSIGEAAISPQLMQQVTPDVVNSSGKARLFQHLSHAVQDKPPLDQIMQHIAQKLNGEQTSRIKAAQTVVQKIAQKRLQGRRYDIEDINDPLGERIIVRTTKDVHRAISAVRDMEKRGAFTITKSEDVRDDTYSAHHIDIKTPQGGRAEIQIMLPDQHLESVANHGLRSVYGEKPPPPVQSLKDRQAEEAKRVSDQKAMQKAAQIQTLSRNGQIPNPQIVAQIVKNG